MDPVIVVGAGPVGLTLSLALAAYGVSTVVLDSGSAEPADTGNRLARTAILRPPTAAFLARLRCSAVDVHGVRLDGWRSLRRGRTAEQVTFPAEAPVHLAQSALTRSLRAALEGDKHVELLPDSHADALELEADGVTVRAGGTWLRGSYLVGCDGARSTVRKLLGIGFAGRTAVERHAVAALRTELPWPGETVLHRSGAAAEITARPLPDDVWRLDWLLPADGALVTPEALIRRVQATLADWCGEPPPYELLDTGVHTVHHRLAQRWRSGRAFLAGDAAHLLGALGTQQLDEGLQDAENLAWKLAHALHHPPAERLLDTYAAERRQTVAARLRAADQALPLIRPSAGWRGALRGGVSATLLADGHLGRGAIGAPAVYPAPPPAEGLLTLGTALGELVEDVEITAPDGSSDTLHARLGGPPLLLFTAPGTRVWDRSHWLTAGLMPKLTEAQSSLPFRTELLIAESYPEAPAHSLLLIRPDGRLCAAMPGVDRDTLQTCAQSLAS